MFIKHSQWYKLRSKAKEKSYQTVFLVMFGMITNDDNDCVNAYPWRQITNIYSITQSRHF